MSGGRTARLTCRPAPRIPIPIMFIRYVVREIDPDSGKRTGIFQAAHRLRNSGTLARYDEERLTAALQWFAKHLNEPTRLTRSTRPHRCAQAICWFKAGAAEHLARAREMQQILDANGVAVEMIASRRAGYVVYEDPFQVAAYPFSDVLA
jgi:hypothetical protein